MCPIPNYGLLRYYHADSTNNKSHLIYYYIRLTFTIVCSSYAFQAPYAFILILYYIYILYTVVCLQLSSYAFHFSLYAPLTSLQAPRLSLYSHLPFHADLLLYADLTLYVHFSLSTDLTLYAHIRYYMFI